MSGTRARRVMLVGLVVAALAAGAVLAAAMAAPAPVVVGGTRPAAPAVSGGRVVWADRTYGNADIFMYDAATRAVSRLTTDAADQTDPAISGDIVVWSDKRTGKAQIRALDLGNGTEIQVSPNVADQVRPAVSGTWVVWEDYRNSYSPAIYARDIAGGTERRIASGTTSNKRPRIAGTLVVWEDYSVATGAGDVRAYDLSTGAARVIANSVLSELLPHTDGRYVVWAQGARGGMDVMALDTVTGARIVVAAPRGEQSFPRVSGGVVYWNDNSAGSRMHFDTFDLATRKTSRFDDAGTSDVTGLDVDGGNTAWLARRGRGWQVVARLDSSLGRYVAGSLFGWLPRATTSELRASAGASAEPLVVTSTSVRDGQLGVNVSAPLRIRFSKPLDPSAANLAHIYLTDARTGGKVRARVAYDKRRRAVTVAPSSRLRGAAYRLVVDDRVVDSTGGQIAESSIVTFATIRTLAATTAPGKVRVRVSTLASVTVVWNPSAGAAFYDVYRSNTPVQIDDYTTQATRVAASVAATGVTIAQRSDEASVSLTYYYVVVADDGAGNRTVSLNALPDPHGVSSNKTDTCSQCHSLHGSGPTPYLGAAGATDCYGCHGSTPAWQYGADSSFDTQARFQDDSVIATGPARAVGPAGSVHRNSALAANGHECDACHSPHRKPYDLNPSLSYHRVVRTQVAAVVPTDNASSAYRYNTDASAVGNQMCFDCHGSAADNAQTLMGVVADSSSWANAGGDHRTNYANTAHGQASKVPAPSTGVPTPSIQCLACHDEHGSAVPRLLGQYDPASGKSRMAYGSTPTTLTGNDNSVCFGCHTNATPSWPASSENASGYPTQGTWPGKPTWDAAYSAVTHTGSFHGAVAWSGAGKAAGDCKNCHVIHGADYQNPLDILRRDSALATTFGSSTFAFCFKCHGAAGPASDRVSRWIPQGVGGEATQTATTRYGHKTLSAGKLPAGSAMPCYDCHNPHGSGSAYGLAIVTQSAGTTFAVGDASGEMTMTPTRSAADVRNFCFTCHSSADRGRGWTGSKMDTVTAPAYVEGIDRTTYAASGAHLRLPPATGHNDGDTASCYKCHGEDYTAVATANNVHNPSAGISEGGQACYGCHGEYQKPMESTGASDTLFFHHVLGGGAFASNGDTATQPGGTGAYPTSSTDVYCISCHADHNYFNPAKGFNLRTNIASPTVTATNTDFVADAGLGYGICVSCHRASIAKDTANIRSDGFSSKTATISGSAFAGSAHHYQIPGTFGGSVFNADCSKCHTDDQTKQYQGAGRPLFGTHFSDERRLLAALGAAVPLPTVNSPGACYRCHSRVASPIGGTKKTADAQDWYGKAMSRGIDIYDAINQAGGSRHPVTGSASGSLECESCHNPHSVVNGNATSDPDNTYASILSTQRNQFCLRCHDGSAPAYQVGASFVPTTVVMTQPDMDKSVYASRGHWSVTSYNCTTCHDPHGSKYPKLLGVYFAGSQTIVGWGITGNNNSVCLTCHGFGSSPAAPTLARIDQEEASRDASGFIMGAITPTRWAGPTVYNNATYSPHGTTAKTYAGKAVSDCKTCHDVHGTANKYRELTATYTAGDFTLCFKCHDGSVAATDIKRYFPASVGGGGNAAANAGHKIATAGGKLPVGSALPCYDCHYVHGSTNSNTDLKGDYRWQNLGDTKANAANSRTFCLGCHVTNDFKDGYGNAVPASDTSNTVEGLYRRPVTKPANKLLLTSNSAHASGAAQGCFECHGSDYASSSSNNVHNPSSASSSGGSACYGCHPAYKPMEDNSGSKTGGAPVSPVNSSVYHHVLGGALGDGDIAPSTAAYPTSATDVYCVSCHTDHNYFNANKAANLRSDIGNTAGSAATNTDFIASGSYGICVSCHTVSRPKQGQGTEQASGGAANTPVIAGAEYATSAHRYTVNSSFGGSTFKAECSKCHSDEQPKTQTGYGFGTHFSAFASILRVLGGFTSDPPKEQACFKCHNATSAPYGETLSAAAKATQNEFGMTSHHPLDKVTCVNCHNVHEASVATPAADPVNTYNAAAVNTTATISAYCLKCHNGTLPARVVDGTTNVPYTVSANATANVGVYFASDGHGSNAGPFFSGRANTGFITAANDVTNDWTNDANITGAPNLGVATSPSDNNFEIRGTFTFPSPMTSIDAASVTVKSRAQGAWGQLIRAAASGVTTQAYADSDALTTGWAIGGTSPAPTRWQSIDEVGAHDGDFTYVVGSAVATYGAGVGAKTIPADATNIQVSVIWTGRDAGTTNKNVNDYSAIRVNGTWYRSGTARNPSATNYTGNSFTDTWPTNPAGGAWNPTTAGQVNGVGVYMSATTANQQVTQAYVQITYDLPAVYNDDTWAIQYTTDGSSWSNITAPNTGTEAALADHTIDLTGILTNANKANFAIRIVGTPAGSPDNAGTVDWDAATLQLTYSGNDPGAVRADCRDCHEQHGSTLTNLLKTSVDGTIVPTYSDVLDEAQCLACHRSGGTPGDTDVARFYPPSAYGTADGSKPRTGHRTENAGTLPAGSAIPCRTCHDPHGGAGSGHMLEVRTQVTAGVDTVLGDAPGEVSMASPQSAANVRKFCFSCHTDPSGSGWNGSSYAPVAAGCQVLGISRTGGSLKMPVITDTGHGIADTGLSCYGCHGDDYTPTGSNVHNPASGKPDGGLACYSCHIAMESPMDRNGATRLNSFHHILGSATTAGDIGPGTGTYPTETGNVYCVSCHTDHNYFSGNKGANLRSKLGNSAGNDPINTDFITGGSPSYGICLGCHSVSLTRRTDQKSGGASAVQTIDGPSYAGSAHDFSAQGSIGGSTFNANCSKCHDDETTGGKFSSTNKFGLHWSAETTLLAGMGATVNGSSSYPGLCYKCHSSTVSDNPNAGSYKDYYGVADMTSTALAVKTDALKVQRHPVESYDGHAQGEGASAGWNQGATRHSTCMDCHNVHAAKKGVTPSPSYANVRGNTPPSLAGALYGVWGVTLSGLNANGTWDGGGTTVTPTQPSYSRVTTSAYQWQVCLKCHSTYAWQGGTVPNVSLDMANTTGKPQTDIGKDFNPALTSYHPIFKQGLNQPPTNKNGNWDSSTGRRRIGGSESGNGLSNTFVDGYLSTSIVVCTDCHGSDAASGSNGPHGSTLNWILKGKDAGIKVTVAGGGVLTPNSTLGGAGNYCVNCHRSDVYAAAGVYANLSRATHSGMCAYPDTTNDPKGMLYSFVNLASCYHCHGARQRSGQPASGGIHGTNLNNWGGGSDPMGYRFMNGASWSQHNFEDVAAGSPSTSNCWTLTAADSYGNCTQHSSGRGGLSLNYYYSTRR